MITIIQGESFPILITLKKGGKILVPNDLSDLMICVGNIRKKLSEETLRFNETSEKWEFYPTQEETLAVSPSVHQMIVSLKYPDGRIRKSVGPSINIQECRCKEEI